MNTNSMLSRQSKQAKKTTSTTRIAASSANKEVTSQITLEKENSTAKAALSHSEREKKEKRTPLTTTKTRKVLGELTASEVQARNAVHAAQSSEDRRETDQANDGQNDTTRINGGRRSEAAALPRSSNRMMTAKRPSRLVGTIEQPDGFTPKSAPRPSILRRQPPRKASEAARASSYTIMSSRTITSQRQNQPLTGREIISASHVTASS